MDTLATYLEVSKSYSKQILDAIDQVHGVQGITDLSIRKVHLEQSYGEFEYLKREIRISTDAPYPLCTGFHEVGHALDALFLNSVSGYTLSQGEASLIAADARKGVLRDWFSVAFQSPPVKAFYEVLRHSPVDSIDYLDASYYIDPAEVWARSYEQFIAQNCKDLHAKEEFSLKRRTKIDFGEAKLRVYWTYQEFVPIQTEIRKALHSIGWL